ncbi:MAG: type II secretion system F family protein [Clostridiales Family XIII bacterium]|jgi:hypothetical protein|nr:type II secretion system F family protein [Clostridiales Family XIII bacterium]
MKAKTGSKAEGFAQRLMDRVPECLTGRADEMEKRLTAAFGGRDFSGEIRAEKRKNAARWLLVAGLFALLAAATAARLAGGGGPAPSMIERPGPFERAARVAAWVKAEYSADSVKKKVEILVRPRSLGEDEKKKLVGETAQRLETLILGENGSLDDVRSDLDLVGRDPETNVDIAWSSDRPDTLDDSGALNRVAAKEGEAVNLKARLSMEDVSETVALEVRLGPPASEGSAGKSLDAVLAGQLKKLNESADGDALALPEADGYGVSYSWEGAGGGPRVMEAALLSLCALMLYGSRYKGIDGKVRAARASMLRDFPEFINKMLILLNAGLVVSAAIERVARDYEERADRGAPKPLYEELAGIRRRVEGANAPLAAELGIMASRSGVRELMRFASIISDNIDKGSALAEKLQAEGELVWSMRRKNAEEAGRIAETKLVMPMALTLLALIMVTIAPAALEM